MSVNRASTYGRNASPTELNNAEQSVALSGVRSTITQQAVDIEIHAHQPHINGRFDPSQQSVYQIHFDSVKSLEDIESTDDLQSHVNTDEESIYLSILDTSDRVRATSLTRSEQQRIAVAYPSTQIPWCLQWPLFFAGYVADAYVQRATALLYIAVTALVISFRHSPWAWYLTCGMAGDMGLRVIGGDRLAVLSCIAEMVTTFLPGSYRIASAPRQFAAICYAALYLVASMTTGFIIDTDNSRVAITVLMSIMLTLLLLESFGISLPALFFESVLVKSGLCSDRYLYKAESIDASFRLKQAVMQASAKFSSQHRIVFTKTSNRAANTVMKYNGKNLGARMIFDPIRNCSIGYAFPLLAIAGMTALFYYGQTIYGLHTYIWKSFAVALVISYGSFVILLALRLYYVPRAVMREVVHPHLRYAYVLLLAVPLLSIDFMLDVSVVYCKVMLWICAPLVLAFVVLILRDWVTEPLTFESFNPSWMLASVGLIVCAFEIPQVYPGLGEVAWLWLALGIFLWGLLSALVIVRLVFAPPLPDSQRTTLFLLVSSGALITAALIFQDPQAVDTFTGPLSSLTEFFHWLTSMMSLLCYALLLSGYFCRSPFNISYWAVAFPSAALALIWMFYSQIGHCDRALPPTQYTSEARCTDNQDSSTLQNLVILLYVNACVTNSIMFVNTVLALIQRRMFLPAPSWSPASFLQLQHLAFRTALYKADQLLVNETATVQHTPYVTSFWNRWKTASLGSTNTALQRSPANTPDSHNHQSLSECLEILKMLELSFNEYCVSKEQVVVPAIRLWLPKLELDQSAETSEILRHLHYLIERLQSALASQNNESQSPTSSFQQQINHVSSLLQKHLERSELALNPLVHYFADVPSSSRLLQRLWNRTDAQTWRKILPWLLTYMPDHAQRMALIDCFIWALSEARPMMGRWLYDGLEPFLYDQLCVDYPEFRSVSISPYVKFW